MNLNRYRGGKGTCYRRIINLMPPHRFYIETHAGGGAVIRHKRPAKINVALDIDPAVKERYADGRYLHITFHCADALKYLEGIRQAEDILIYCDPPYMMQSRKSGRLYRYEYNDEDHIKLLTRLNEMPLCRILISGYWTELYSRELKAWNHISFEVMTKGGKKATEHLWFNYDTPTELHEYSFLGDTFRDRERIKRKRKRWISNLKKMGRLERMSIIEAIREEFIFG